MILLISFCFIAGKLCYVYASGDKPAVANISPCHYLEGFVDMKVSLEELVKKGQLLFTISTDHIQIAKAQYENRVWYYKEEYGRVKKLAKTHSKSIENVQEAKYNLKHAIECLKMENMLIDKWSKYYAPFDGIVTKIYNYNGSGTSRGSGSRDNNAVLEIAKLEDYKKGEIKIGPAVAQVVSILFGTVDLRVTLEEKVKKDQLLFKIDTAIYEIKNAKRKANLEYNKARYERTKKLYEQNNESLKNYQTAEYEYRDAAQGLKRTELQINKRSCYYAPFDGIVTNITHYTGSFVFAGHKVLEVTKN